MADANLVAKNADLPVLALHDKDSPTLPDAQVFSEEIPPLDLQQSPFTSQDVFPEVPDASLETEKSEITRDTEYTENHALAAAPSSTSSGTSVTVITAVPRFIPVPPPTHKIRYDSLHEVLSQSEEKDAVMLAVIGIFIFVL